MMAKGLMAAGLLAASIAAMAQVPYVFSYNPGPTRGTKWMAKASDGLDGRRVRKGIFAAMASDLETAKDPNRLTRAQVEASFRQLLRTRTKGTHR